MILVEALRNTSQLLKTERWIFTYIFLAILTNIIAFAIAVGLIWALLFQLGTSISDLFAGNIQSILELVLLIGTLSIAVLLGVYLFSVISSIANAPVYGLMVDKILLKYPNVINIDTSLTWYTSIWLTILHEAKKLVVIGVFFVVLLVIGFLPFGAFFGLILSAVQLVFISGLDLLEPLFIHQRMNFRSKIMWIQRNLREYGLFLCISGIILPLPIINIVLLPFMHIIIIQMWVLSEQQS